MAVARPQRTVQRTINVRPRTGFDECPSIGFRVPNCFANVLVRVPGKLVVTTDRVTTLDRLRGSKIRYALHSGIV